MQRKRSAPARRAAVGAAAVLAWAACARDTVVDVLGDRPVLNVQLSPGDAVLPSGTATASATSVRLTLTGLPALGSGSYAVWLYKASDGSFAPAAAKVTVGGSTASGPTFTSPGDTATIVVLLDNTTSPDFTAYNSVVLSIEGGAPGSAPSTARFLFGEYRTAAGTYRSGALTFGKFDPAAPVTFRVAGVGRVQFYRDSLIARLERVPPPPAGFHYQSYLVRMVGPTPEASTRLHTVTPDEIGNATDRVAESEAGGFANFNTYMLLLEADASPSFGRARVLVSDNYVDRFPPFFVRR